MLVLVLVLSEAVRVIVIDLKAGVLAGPQSDSITSTITSTPVLSLVEGSTSTSGHQNCEIGY